MKKGSTIHTIKINPAEFTPIYARYISGRVARFTLDIIERLKTDPAIIEIYNADGVRIYKKEV